MKKCSKCNNLFDRKNFYSNKTAKDHLSHYCKLCTKTYNAKWDKNHPEIGRKKSSKWRIANPKKRVLSATRYQVKYPEKANYRNAKRRANKLNATPSWLTKSQLLEIKEFYILAQELRWLSNEPLDVDHIIPLQGENVCGLHVPWNLQILPESANSSKSNKILR